MIFVGLDHDEQSNIPSNMDRKEMNEYLGNIFQKTKNGGQNLYFSLASYNTHTEIREILS